MRLKPLYYMSKIETELRRYKELFPKAKIIFCSDIEHSEQRHIPLDTLNIYCDDIGNIVFKQHISEKYMSLFKHESNVPTQSIVPKTPEAKWKVEEIYVEDFCEYRKSVSTFDVIGLFDSLKDIPKDIKISEIAMLTDGSEYAKKDDSTLYKIKPLKEIPDGYVFYTNDPKIEKICSRIEEERLDKLLRSVM